MSSEQSDVIFARIHAGGKLKGKLGTLLHCTTTGYWTRILQFRHYRYCTLIIATLLTCSTAVIVLCGLGNPRRPHIPNRDIY